MGVKPLTDTQIKRAKSKEKAYTLSDGRGLQLLIKPNGSKLWEFYYHSPTKYKRRKTSLGRYPEVKLHQARVKAQKYRDVTNSGFDPIDYFNQLKKEEQNNTKGVFANVVNEWLELRKTEVKRDTLKPKSYQRIESLLLNDTLPYFKRANIRDIKHYEITNIIELKNKKAPVSAKRLLQYLSKLWLYAVSKGYCEHNIIYNIDKTSHITRTRINHHAKIVKLDILSELINAIYDYKGHYSTKNALKFVLHIPLRARNLVSLKWSYIDFDKRLLTIPRELMKISDSNLPDFTMPLSDEVINILKEQHIYTKSNKYVFVSDYGAHLNPETTNRALQRLGFNDENRGRKQRTHSFRGTFRSLADTYQREHNATKEVKERALDHTIGNLSERAYTDKADYLEQLKELMDWWSGFIMKVKEM